MTDQRTSPHLQDDELARRVAAGDDDAFGELYRRHAARLLATGQRILRDSADADDAVQEASVKALRALRRGQLRGSVQPWLDRIVRNEALDLVRARRPWAELDVEAASSMLTPESTVIAREELTALAADLRALPDRQRTALLLRHAAGCTYAELADHLGSSQLAARQAVAEARAALAEDARAREEACDRVRAVLLEPDRRRHRTRLVRSHLRGCSACRAFQHTAVPPRRLLLLPSGLLAGLGVQAPGWLSALMPGGAAVAGSGRAATAALAAVVAVSLPTLEQNRPPTAPTRPEASSNAGARARAAGRQEASAQPSRPASTPTESPIDRVAAAAGPSATPRERTAPIAAARPVATEEASGRAARPERASRSAASAAQTTTIGHEARPTSDGDAAPLRDTSAPPDVTDAPTSRTQRQHEDGSSVDPEAPVSIATVADVRSARRPESATQPASPRQETSGAPSSTQALADGATAEPSADAGSTRDATATPSPTTGAGYGVEDAATSGSSATAPLHAAGSPQTPGATGASATGA